MNTRMMKKYARLLVMVSLLLVIVGCGLLEFFGKRDETNPTEPCDELIPTATPVPMPTFVPSTPTPTPAPGKTPIPIVTVTPPPTPTPTPTEPCSGSGQVLICNGETTEDSNWTIEEKPEIPSASKAPSAEKFEAVTINW